MIYKLCSIRPKDGKLVSLFYLEGCARRPSRYPVLEYALGEVTEATTENGVFCYPGKRQVQSQLDVLREPNRLNNYRLALFEVEPAGPKLRAYYSGVRNFRAVILTKLLWKDTDKRLRMEA